MKKDKAKHRAGSYPVSLLEGRALSRPGARRGGHDGAWLSTAARAFTAFVVFACLVSAGWAAEVSSIFVSVAPQAYLVKQIGGDDVDVTILIAAGREPHTFEPSPREVVALSRTAVYFTVGLPFEEILVAKLKDGGSSARIVDMTAGIERLPMSDEHGEDDEDHEADHHGEEAGHDEHAHGGSDPHVWLSPRLLKVMAANTEKALAEAIPEKGAVFAERAKNLASEIDALDAELKEALEGYEGRSFYVFHPAFGYFADAYGLNQAAVEIEGKSPTPKALAALIASARADGVKVIFVQPQFDPTGAKVIADAIGGAVVPLDPLAEDVPANLRAAAEKIAEALAEQ